MKRRHIHFDNGFVLSIITGEGSYTDDEGQYEVALVMPNGIVQEPTGYQTPAMVQNLIEECANKWGAPIDDRDPDIGDMGEYE